MNTALPSTPHDAQVADISDWNACLLICDVSGFVKAVNAHQSSLGDKVGAEKARLWLDAIFEIILSQIERSGGDVIQFIGDAVVARFDTGCEAMALNCALQIRAQCRKQDESSIQVKTGLASGAGHLLTLQGSEHGGLQLALGEPVTQALEALQQAGQEDVVCHISVHHRLGPAARAFEFTPLGDDFQKLTGPIPTLATAPRLSTHEAAPAQDSSEIKLLTLLYIEWQQATGSASPQDLLRVCQNLDPLAKEHNATLIGLCQTQQGYRFQFAVGSLRSEINDVELAIQMASRVLGSLARGQAPNSRASIGYGNAWQGRYGAGQYKLFNAHGREVNLAARLLATQGPGHICLTEGARQQLNNRLYLKDLGEFHIKGEPQTVRIHRVEAQQETPQKLPATPLYGRTIQLRQALDALDAAKHPKQSCLIEVTGAAGVGKSTFISGLDAALTQAGEHTIELRSNPQSRLLPYAVAYPLLLELAALAQAHSIEDWLQDSLKPHPELAPWIGLISLISPLHIPLSKQAELANPETRANAITNLFKTLVQQAITAQPVTFFIEDLQWFDNASILLLTAALFQAPGCRSLYSIRTSEGKQATAMLQERLQKIRQGRLDIALKPFSLSETPAFLLSWFSVNTVPAALSEALHKLSEGNLLLMSSLLQHLEQEGVVRRLGSGQIEVDFRRLEQFSSIPTNMEHALQTRIDYLPPSHRQILSQCSIFKTAFSRAELQAVFHHTDDKALESILSELLKRRLLKPSPGSEGQSHYVFEHQVIERCTYDRIPFEDRKRLHAQCADWLENQLKQSTNANPLRLTIRLAAQYDWAGLLDKALPLAQAAVDYAMKLGALDEAADRLDKLLSWHEAKLLPKVTALERALWMEKLAQIVYAQGRLTEAEDRYAQALVILGYAPPSPPRFIRSYVHWGFRLVFTERLLPSLRRSKLKQITPEAQMAIRLYICLSELSFLVGSGYMNYVYLIQAVKIGRHFETTTGDQVRMLLAMAIVAQLFGYRKQYELFIDDAQKGLPRIQNEVEKFKAVAHANHRMGYMNYGDGLLEETQKKADQGIYHARLTQEFHTELLIYSMHIVSRVAQGRFEEALEFYENYEERAKKFAANYFNIFHQYGLLNQKVYSLAMMGRLAEAREHLNFLERMSAEHKFSGTLFTSVNRCKLMVLFCEQNWAEARQLAAENAVRINEDVTNKAYMFTCVSLPLEVLLDAQQHHAPWSQKERTLAHTLLNTLNGVQNRFRLVTPTYLILKARWQIEVERKVGHAERLLEQALALSNDMGLRVEQEKASGLLAQLRENTPFKA